MEREKARQRTHDALKRKMLAGHVTGGRVYGYRNRRGARRRRASGAHVTRVIDAPQAAVVRRIFAAVAAGQGFTIASPRRCNADGVPSPAAGGRGPDGDPRDGLPAALSRARSSGTRRGWVGSRRHEGEGRPARVRVAHAGRPRAADHPRGSLARPRTPALRARRRPLYRASARDWAPGRSGASGPVSPERLHRVRRRAAARWSHGGASGQRADGLPVRLSSPARRIASARMRNTAPVTTVETAVLDGLRGQVLAPEILGPVIRERRRPLSRRGRSNARLPSATLEQRLAQLDRELARSTTAVAQGGPLPSLLAKIREHGSRRRPAIERSSPRWGRPRRQHATGWDARTVERPLRARLDGVARAPGRERRRSAPGAAPAPAGASTLHAPAGWRRIGSPATSRSAASSPPPSLATVHTVWCPRGESNTRPRV